MDTFPKARLARPKTMTGVAVVSLCRGLFGRLHFDETGGEAQAAAAILPILASRFDVHALRFPRDTDLHTFKKCTRRRS